MVFDAKDMTGISTIDLTEFVHTKVTYFRKTFAGKSP